MPTPHKIIYRGATYVLANDLSKRVIIDDPAQIAGYHKALVLQAIKNLSAVTSGLAESADFSPLLNKLQNYTHVLSNSISVLSKQPK